MGIERVFAHSPSIVRLAQKLRDANYRRTYVGAHVRQFLARQLRELRGDLSQAEFGKKINKAQNVVSRLEDPSYGKATLSTLLDIAAKLDRALIVRFVDFKTFLKFTEDQSDAAAAPEPYREFEISEFAWEESLKGQTSTNVKISMFGQQAQSAQQRNEETFLISNDTIPFLIDRDMSDVALKPVDAMQPIKLPRQKATVSKQQQLGFETMQ